MYLSQTENMPGSKIATDWEKCFRKLQFAVSFMPLRLRRGVRKIPRRWEKVRWGSDYRIVKILCSFEGGHTLEGGVWKEEFQKCVKLDAQTVDRASLKEKINLLLKKVYVGVYLPWPAQLRVYDQITLWCCFPQNPFSVFNKLYTNRLFLFTRYKQKIEFILEKHYL